jgi:hypothetical protein
VIVSGGPEGIGYAMAAAVLLPERSTLITGSTMFVDGGMCLQVYSRSQVLIWHRPANLILSFARGSDILRGESLRGKS